MITPPSVRGPAALLWALCAAALVTGCATTEIEQNKKTNGSQADAGPTSDVGPGGADGGADPDMGIEPPPAPRRGVISVTGGGGAVETPRHRIRLMVAPPMPARAVQTPKHQIRLGAGAAQHGQGR